MFQFQKAEKTKRKLRLAIFGPSGAGKTFSALRMATGMVRDGERIAVIDTEYGSSAMYADRFSFDMLSLERAGVDIMVQAIQAAAQAEYAVLIIDSLSLAWQELLEEIDRLARAKYGGNTWSAWSEGTPKQKRLVRALLSYPGHIIATMRAKTEWSLEKDDRGRVRPVRVGLAPEQGKGIEYEFDMLMTISESHEATGIKDRTGRFQDSVLVPDEKFGKALRGWLEEGKEPEAKVHAPRPVEQRGNGANGNGTNGHHAPWKSEPRPWSAETVIAAIRHRAQVLEAQGKGITEDVMGQWGATVHVLEWLGDRHAFTRAVFGHRSTKNLTPAQKLALVQWVKPRKSETTGQWLPAPDEAAWVEQEFKNVVEWQLQQEGQQALLEV